MPTELLAYIGAAAMVVIAFVAYRYWRSTATYARQVRESHARQRLESYRTSNLLPPPDPGADPPHPADDGSDSPPDQPEHDSAVEAVEETSPVEPGEPVAEEFSADEEPSEDPADLADPKLVQTPGETESEPDSAETPVDQADLAPDEAPEETKPEPEPVAEEETSEDLADLAPARALDEARTQPEVVAEDGDALEGSLAEAEAVPTDTLDVSESSEIATETDRGADQSEPTEIASPAPEESEPSDQAGPSTAIAETSPDTAQEPESQRPFRLIEELEPREASAPIANSSSVNQLLRDLDEQLTALPSGIELMNLSLLERRRVADRREDLMGDRARLLEQRKRGTHRRSRRRRKNSDA